MTARPIHYACEVCKQPRSKDELVVKRVQYREMGSDGKVLRTRVVRWVCRVPNDKGVSCLDLEDDYNRIKYESAPGTIAKRETEEAIA